MKGKNVATKSGRDIAICPQRIHQIFEEHPYQR